MRPCEGSIFRTFLHQILTFFKRIFSGEVEFEVNRETKIIPRGPGACSPGNFFENLHTAMGILANLNNLLRKFCSFAAD